MGTSLHIIILMEYPAPSSMAEESENSLAETWSTDESTMSSPEPKLRQVSSKRKLINPSERLSGFDYKNSVPWKAIVRRFGPSLTQRELLSIANLLAQTCARTIDRDAKRSKAMMIKWFDENWHYIGPFFNHVVLVEIPDDQ